MPAGAVSALLGGSPTHSFEVIPVWTTCVALPFTACQPEVFCCSGRHTDKCRRWRQAILALANSRVDETHYKLVAQANLSWWVTTKDRFGNPRSRNDTLKVSLPHFYSGQEESHM